MRGQRVETGRQTGRASTGVRGLVLPALGFLLFAGLVFAALGGTFALWFDHAYSGQLRAVLASRAPVIRILDRNERLISTRTQRQPHIAIDDLPPHLIAAVISTEDRRFHEHRGVDPLGLARALWRNLTGGRLREGGSTITQQLAKNVYFSGERTLTRKFRELVVALWFEQHFDKRQILEFYLNRVYFGAGATYGIEAAARRYFDKSARDLSLAEAALLAGVLKAPSYYSPLKNPQRARERAGQVLDNMLATGAISETQAVAAREAPAQLVARRGRQRLGTGSEYAEDWIMERLRLELGPIDNDLIVRTSLDLDLQKQAQKLVAATIAEHGTARHVDQAAALMLDERGGVRLLVGGASYADSQFNRAIKARRQPGSAFKPIVFLAAMENRLTPSSLRIDEPVDIDGWRPRNASGLYHGEMTLRQALALSVNTIAAALVEETGIDNVIRTARRLGITSPLARHPSLALGTSEVSPLELTAAYVPLINGGRRIEAHIIEKVTTGEGQTIYEHASAGPRVIARDYIYDMNDMLGAVVSNGTGREARIDGHPTAGKTGTTQHCRDAWFIGYTGHFAATVWMGNDNGAPTDHVTGSTLPARLWKDIMTLAHQELEPRELPGMDTGSPGQPISILVEPELPEQSIIVEG